MKSKEELEKEPMPYDNETPKKCPACGNWFLDYPALSRRDNETYICPQCGVREAMEDFAKSRKSEALEEATTKALLEDPINEAFKKPMKESVSWDYFDQYEDMLEKYMPDQGEGNTIASQIVTAINKLIYKWYNDGDVFDNNYYLQGWANDISSYANWLAANVNGAKLYLDDIKNAKSDSDYENILKDLADRYLASNFLEAAERNPKKGSIYECDGPYSFTEYSEEEDEDYYEEEYEDEEELDESKDRFNKQELTAVSDSINTALDDLQLTSNGTTGAYEDKLLRDELKDTENTVNRYISRMEESKDTIKKELNKDELLNKLEDYVLNQYTDFNDKLYSDFGDIQMGDKDNNKRSIYIYYDVEEDKISVTVGAAGARTFVDTLDEVAQFINAEIAKVNAQDEEIKNLTTESIDKDHDEYLKKMDKKYKTFCKNLEITEDPDDALFALDELEGQFGDEEGEYQELREFIHNELIESKEHDLSKDLFGDEAARRSSQEYPDIFGKEIKDESKAGKYTDKEIIKAIKEVIKDGNGIFTDDSKYDVIEKLTGISDIELQPKGLWERVNEIYETQFNKTESVEVKPGANDIDISKDIFDSFNNAKSFINNFGKLIVIKDKYDKLFKVYKPSNLNANNWIYYSTSIDGIEGFLDGAIKANNGIFKDL